MRMQELELFLQQQKQNHLYRQRSIVESPQGTEITIDGRSYLNFCSNDYLGHANHPKVIEAFITGARLYGVGSGASHLINGHSAAHHKLEQELAEFVNRPRALLFSTGYMANLGVISALLQKGDHVFEDRLNHASLLDAGLLSQARLQRYQHADVSDLEHKLSQCKAESRLIVSDGVFSMDGDFAPIKQLAVAAKQHNAWLMIDDAHGIGVLGENGRGLIEQASLDSESVPILVGTLGKAFGTFGAFVAGDETLIETLVQKARSYIYTTALPPAIAEATRASLKLINEEAWRRQKLHENIDYFRKVSNQLGLSVMPSSSAIQPVIIGNVENTMNISHQLKQHGILISAIRPPTVPEGTARLRITLCTEHEHSQIEQLAQRLSQLVSS